MLFGPMAAGSGYALNVHTLRLGDDSSAGTWELTSHILETGCVGNGKGSLAVAQCPRRADWVTEEETMAGPPHCENV